MIIEKLTVGSLSTNCYILGCEEMRTAAIIDPGAQPKDILAALERLELDPAYILLTHGHFDHTGAISRLRKELPNIPVYLHPAEANLLGINEIMPEVGETHDYGEGHVLPVGTIAVRIYHTPGHTPGGVTLRAGYNLFTGDTLFKGSMGRTDLGGDDAALRASLKRLGSLPGDFRVLPGHGDETTMEAERWSNFCLIGAMKE